MHRNVGIAIELAIDDDRQRVMERGLSVLVKTREALNCIRSDNGPKSISKAPP